MALAAFALGATYVVNPDGTGDFPTIQAAIVATTSGDEVLLANGTPTIRCCDVWGNTGGGGDTLAPEMIDGGSNIYLDPLFCEPPNDFYTLNADSPCAPEQNPDCGRVGARSVACGPSPVEITAWGRIKTRFRG